MSKWLDWTENEDEILSYAYGVFDWEDLFLLFPNRSKNGIMSRAKKINLHRLEYFREDEIKYIKSNYSKMSYTNIAKELNRPSGSVKNKARELGLVKQEKWSDDEIDILRNVFGKYGIEEITERFLPKRTSSSVYHMCQIMDLSDDVSRYLDNDKLIFDLTDLAERLKRTPIRRELSKYGLASADVYDKRFGGFRNACELAGIEPNKTIFNQHAIYYSKNNDKCDSKSEQIITDYLIDNKIPYKKGDYYSTICSVGNVGKKMYDWLINGIIVEFFGIPRYKKYQERMQQKRDICKQNNLILLEIYEKDLLKLDEVFSMFMQK